MTPKEKATWLISHFSRELPWYSEKDNISKSKRCALICVEEIIGSCFHPNLSYWQEVKQEINKL